MAVTARWLEVLWRCPCNYCNIATYRCYGCGSRPPRDLRQAVAAIPVVETEAATEAAAS